MCDMSKYFIVSDKFNTIIRMNSVDFPTSVCQKFTYVLYHNRMENVSIPGVYKQRNCF